MAGSGKKQTNRRTCLPPNPIMREGVEKRSQLFKAWSSFLVQGVECPHRTIVISVPFPQDSHSQAELGRSTLSQKIMDLNTLLILHHSSFGQGPSKRERRKVAENNENEKNNCRKDRARWLRKTWGARKRNIATCNSPTFSLSIQNCHFHQHPPPLLYLVIVTSFVKQSNDIE